MATPEKLIFLEFNELCPPLLSRWMDDGILPNFRRLHDRAQVFTTVADAEPPALEPWIQWVSMHTGMPYSEHGVFRLTEGARAGHPDIWSVLRGGGVRTMNFMSMNCPGFEEGVFLGDPWCETEAPHPAELSAFHDFVRAMVQEYTNPDAPSRAAMAARFVAFAARRGLSAATVGGILRQLAAERMHDGRLSYRRAFVLDWLATDLFRWYWRRERPDFATFFLNSTAHMQHAYWRHMDPDIFAARPGDAERSLYGDAIREGYRNMDRLLGRLLPMQERYGVRFAFASALSQQPYLDGEGSGGRRYYRPRDVRALLDRLGVRYLTCEPVMTHQYVLRFAESGDREAARAALSPHRLGADRLFGIADAAGSGLIFDCHARTEIGMDAAVDLGGARVPFHDLFYALDQSKSGRHHPDGCLWIGEGTPCIHGDKVSILDVFPTLLSRYGVPLPPGHSAQGRCLPVAEPGVAKAA